MATSAETTTSSGGVGFLGLLCILFIGLKLGGVIDWSWWWVVAPLWGGVLLIIALLLVAWGFNALADRMERR